MSANRMNDLRIFEADLTEHGFSPITKDTPNAVEVIYLSRLIQRSSVRF